MKLRVGFGKYTQIADVEEMRVFCSFFSILVVFPLATTVEDMDGVARCNVRRGARM